MDKMVLTGSGFNVRGFGKENFEPAIDSVFQKISVYLRLNSLSIL